MIDAPTAPAPNITLFMGAGSDGLGNLMYKVREGDTEYLLKLYRLRWQRWQEFTEPLAARFIVGTSGRDIRSRHTTERTCLTLWASEGFDVPRIFDKPLPEGFDPPALWMEYCPGRLLADLLSDEAVPWEEKAAHLKRLGQELGRRHQRAIERSEPLLIQKHGSIVHTLLYQDRMITIDLEGSFKPGFDLIEALGQELAGYLRSIAKRSEGCVDEAFQALIDGYPSQELLKQVTYWGAYGKSLRRTVTRWSDQRKRNQHSKTEVMARLHNLL